MYAGDEEDDGGVKSKKRPCCISHGFFRSASRNPSRIAVVHAGAARGSVEASAEGSSSLSKPPGTSSSVGSPSRSSPPLCPGDRCFTCGEVLAAVESFARRIRRVLDGGGDPDLVRPEGFSDNAMLVADAKSSLATRYRIPQIVGVYIHPSVEYIVTALAILRSGEAFLPLDPLWPEERILSTISSSNTALIITSKPYFPTDTKEQLNATNWIVDMTGRPALYLDIGSSQKKDLSQYDLVWPCGYAQLRKFCYLMYTSGSTGKPKGVCGTEEGLLNRFWWKQELIPLSTKDILLFKTSISFVDHLQEFLCALLTSTTLVIPPFSDLKAYPTCLVDFLEVYHITRLTSVPSLMRLILPSLESLCFQKSSYLKVLVLSGEIFSISLWNNLCRILPETIILNLYGSTEVSGDCTFFDCKNLPGILENESLTSVPIGRPILNCETLLDGEANSSSEGEICVSGACLFLGYLDEQFTSNAEGTAKALSFRTGDFARRLRSGDLMFLGRKDRIVKVNGTRVALEEIENALMEHPEVSEAAVTFKQYNEIDNHLEAYLVMKADKELQSDTLPSMDKKNSLKDVASSLKNWLVKKLPSVMVPSYYYCIGSLPMSVTGKIDYLQLKSSTPNTKQHGTESKRLYSNEEQLQIIKEVFAETLMAEDVADNDDFFVIGGNSISAAQAAFKLGIDVRLLYAFPSPLKLLNGLIDRKDKTESIVNSDDRYRKRLRLDDNMAISLKTTGVTQSTSPDDFTIRNSKNQSLTELEKIKNSHSTIGYSGENNSPQTSLATMCNNLSRWISNFLSARCSFSRSNRYFHESESTISNMDRMCLSIDVLACKKAFLQELWKVPLRSCVDASPLIVLMNGKLYILIGSHSHIFLCIDAISGAIQWEIQLEDRIECSAAITGDFSQVVVGCFAGYIYFLDFMTGKMSWQFQTNGEVKMQPVVDEHRTLIWCGSHDHSLYAFDYKEHHCIYKVSCGGSIYGSPTIDMVDDIIYVASTSGLVMAISLKGLQFKLIWQYDAKAPIFGSLTLDSQGRNVICCLVNGHVIALNSKGIVVWKAIVGGPIFAGACISSVLPDQVLICCRDGKLYSFDNEGCLLWEYEVGDPITSSAHVDEQIQLTSGPSNPCERLACICSSSGKIHVIRIRTDAKRENARGQSKSPSVQEFAVMSLEGDIFSSPVMVAGCIFVGCRDDYAHCISLIAPTISNFDSSLEQPLRAGALGIGGEM